MNGFTKSKTLNDFFNGVSNIKLQRGFHTDMIRVMMITPDGFSKQLR